MKKSIIISIPEPCHENWSEMTATEKGKFCGVCTKEVIDFTKTSDEEIAKKVINGNNLCGRFKKSQLDREVKIERASRFNLMPYAASLLMPLTMLSTSVTKASTHENVFNKTAISLGIGSNMEKSIVQISGYVTDTNGNPIAQAEVLVLETGQSVWTKNDGSYTLKCVSGSTLIFQKADMKPYQITVGTKHSTVQVLLEQDSLSKIEIMGDIAMLEDISPPVVGRIGTIRTGTKIEFSEKNKAATHQITISGIVTDQSGLPLSGVNITAAGTSNKTQTNTDGTYRIELEEIAKLIFSYEGYDNIEITTSNISNDINVAMAFDIRIMGGIVQGISITQKEDYGLVPFINSIKDFTPWPSKEERKAYTKKINAYKRVKQEQAKAKRLARRKKK